MTDDEINRAVAERVMGWTKHDGLPRAWKRADGSWAGWWCEEPLKDIDDDVEYADSGYRIIPGRWLDAGSRVWDINDPAAWGALLIHLTPFWPRLVCNKADGSHWSVYLYDATSRVVGFSEDAAPGRALALAALRAYGVEV